MWGKQAPPNAQPNSLFASGAAGTKGSVAPAWPQPSAPTTPFSFAPPVASNPSASASASASLPVPLTIAAVAATTPPDPTETALRQQQAALFTPAVRRDCYHFLLNPKEPGVAPAVPSAGAAAAALEGRIPFEVALIASSSKAAASSSTGAASAAPTPAPLDTFAFIERPPPAQRLPAGWQTVDDATLLHGLDRLGEADALPLALTKAFEHFLASQAASWGACHVASLSVEFVVAFGVELTPRLDVHHRIRSSKLSNAELATLTTPPYAAFVDASLLARFQAVPAAVPAQPAPRLLSLVPPASTPPAPPAAPSPPAAAPALQLKGIEPTAPESPRAAPLPLLPPAAAPFVQPAPPVAAQLFVKAS